ncbi:MAG TPA: Uma2 family endonuclease, partial [Planctomycetaceae bacterium]|nr:Uma2 family endonuclease [Planctomycetaceae bacterium]
MTTESLQKTKLTYADYMQIPEDLCQHEIIDGEHYVNPAPNLYHQTVSRRIQFILYAQIELRNLGVVFNAPCDVQLSPHDILQPDLAVVLAQRKHILTPTKIKGTPDLVVEILSPSTEARDRNLKRERYQAVGVPEYWIVDPFEHTVEQLVLRDGVYQQLPESTV